MLFVTFPYMFLKYKSRTIPIRDVRAHFRFISFLCSAIFRVLFSGQSRRLRQTNSKPNERTSCASCQFFLLLFAANVRAWVTLEQAVKRTFLCACVCCFSVYFKVLWSLLWVWLVVCNIAYAQFQLCPTTFILCSSTYGRLIWSVVRFAYYASKLSGCCRSAVQRGVWAMCNHRAIARDNATERECE